MADAFQKEDEAVFTELERLAAPLVKAAIKATPHCKNHPAEVLGIAAHALFNATGRAMPAMDYEGGLAGAGTLLAHVMVSTSPPPTPEEAGQIIANVTKLTARIYAGLLLLHEGKVAGHG